MNTDSFRTKRSIYWGLAYFLILSVLSCALPATAQFTTSRLSGTVVDSSGLPVQGATVNVVQQGTAYTQTTTTGSSGEYLFPSLPVGTYQITVNMTGFSTFSQQGVTLATGQAVTLPVQLKLGSTRKRSPL